MSHEALNPEQFEGHLYHATPASNRESIEKEGLRSSLAVMGSGVFGWHHRETAHDYGGHKMGDHVVVEFKPTKVTSRFDPVDPASRRGYSTSEAVPPENIVRIHHP